MHLLTTTLHAISYNLHIQRRGTLDNNQKSIALLYTNSETSEKESKKKIPFKIMSKNKIPRNKPDQGGGRLTC